MNKKILIADDHQIITFGISILLKNHFSDISVDCVKNYDEVKEKIKNEKFDLVILDIIMPGSTFKFMVKELKLLQEDLMIMIFSSHTETVAIEYIKQGAEGFVNKLSSEKTPIKAVKSILEDGYHYPFALMDMVLNRSERKGIEILSVRELEVFKHVIEGHGNLEIANVLKINASTVSTYKRRIYAKLGVKNVIELSKMYHNAN